MRVAEFCYFCPDIYLLCIARVCLRQDWHYENLVYENQDVHKHAGREILVFYFMNICCLVIETRILDHRWHAKDERWSGRYLKLSTGTIALTLDRLTFHSWLEFLPLYHWRLNLGFQIRGPLQTSPLMWTWWIVFWQNIKYERCREKAIVNVKLAVKFSSSSLLTLFAAKSIFLGCNGAYMCSVGLFKNICRSDQPIAIAGRTTF